MRTRSHPTSRHRSGLILLAAALAAAAVGPVAAGAAEYAYLSPRPGSDHVSVWNNVAVRDGRAIDPASLTPDRLSVAGSASGVHAGALRLSDDGRTIVFVPDVPFAFEETVTVVVGDGIRTAYGEALPARTFSFVTAADEPAFDPPLDGEVGEEPAEIEAAGPATLQSAAWTCGQLPSRYAPVQVLESHDPDPACYFLTPLNSGIGRLEIVDRFGRPIFYRRTSPAADFKLQPDGRLTFYERNRGGANRPKFFAMDAAYAVVDSFAAGNGYTTDSHELKLLPDGHALIMAYDSRRVRMDLVVPGGYPGALVIGTVIQELDTHKDVVFQWRSWDHIPVTDLASPSQSLTARTIDYAHGNAIDLDLDGNLLVSFRHLNEITKIDRSTGEIIWRWGPNGLHNDFTHTNDTRGFSHQHDVRRLPNGHITMFDNGNYLDPAYSSAREYALDEDAKTATLVWSYATPDELYAWFLGATQRRADGGTVVCFGGADDGLRLVDLDAAGEPSLVLGLAAGMTSYRGFRFPWRTTRFATDVESLDFGDVPAGGVATRPLTVRNDGASPFTIDCIETTDPAFAVDAALPIVLDPGEARTLTVAFEPHDGVRHDAALYLRRITDTELIALDVTLAGAGNRPPDCGGARASIETLWPPNHQWVPVTVEGVTDPDGDPLTISITGITQDEPVRDLGDGQTCPDAEVESAVVRLRAERSAHGDGRVVRVAFTADDGRGGTCDGAVTVCVPLDAEGSAACVDGGQTEDALAACPDRRSELRAEPEVAYTLAITSAPPAGARATVSYALPADGPVALEVYDPAGRLVRTLARGPATAGEHVITWRTERIAPGVYFYRLRAGDTFLSRSFVVLR